MATEQELLNTKVFLKRIEYNMLYLLHISCSIFLFQIEHSHVQFQQLKRGLCPRPPAKGEYIPFGIPILIILITS